MIKPSELRLGNWVFDDEGLFAIVVGMRSFDHSVRCDEEEGCELLVDIYRKDGTFGEGYVCESELCKPIPLTPEILEKCGFCRNDQFYSNGKFEFKVELTKMGNEMFMVPNALYCLSFQYLHTFQNLYFANTGEELNYQP